jgi:Na+/melibiose symporter-like transporter
MEDKTKAISIILFMITLATTGITTLGAIIIQFTLLLPAGKHRGIRKKLNTIKQKQEEECEEALKRLDF